jgi:hypothetical protein
MINTQPIFILGSGRSGTLQIAELFQSTEVVESHHEYLFESMLKPSVLYKMNQISDEDIRSILKEVYVPAIHYSSNEFWVDSSNALPWIVKPLYDLFPNAIFIHLIRDGRKVVSSFFHKFEGIIYDDNCVSILMNWLEGNDIIPPPEKKYWRPMPLPEDALYKDFCSYDRFERLCYYWKEVNVSIQSSFAFIPEAQKYTFKLEDIVSDESKLKSFFNAAKVPYDNIYFQTLKRPVNVEKPKNNLLSSDEKIKFNRLCHDTMQKFEYLEKDEYLVKY